MPARCAARCAALLSFVTKDRAKNKRKKEKVRVLEMDAKKYLEQVELCNLKINNKLLELEEWEALATKTTVVNEGERVQSSSSNDGMVNVVIKIIDVKNEINEMIDSYVDLKNDVIKTIEKVTDPLEYQVLHKKYIQGVGINEIARQMNFSTPWVCKVHKRAIQKIQAFIESV